MDHSLIPNVLAPVSPLLVEIVPGSGVWTDTFHLPFSTVQTKCSTVKWGAPVSLQDGW